MKTDGSPHQGRAIQDVLWDERTRLRGTTVRLYEPATDSWRITWFGPDDPTFVVGPGPRGGPGDRHSDEQS